MHQRLLEPSCHASLRTAVKEATLSLVSCLMQSFEKSRKSLCPLCFAWQLYTYIRVTITDHVSFPRVSFLCLTVVLKKTHEYGCTWNKESYSLGNDTWYVMGKKHCNATNKLFRATASNVVTQDLCEYRRLFVIQMLPSRLMATIQKIHQRFTVLVEAQADSFDWKENR